MDKEKQKKHIIDIMKADEELGLYDDIMAHPLTPDECFKKPKYSKDYQIGNLIGQNIIPDLPTLSTDMLKTFAVIKVPDNLTEVWNKKKRDYRKLKYDTEESTKRFYEDLSWYKVNIEKVFLKEEVSFTVYDFFEEEFTEDMIKGFDDAIWDCDLSHYVFSSAKIGDITSTLKIKMKYNE